MKNKKPEYILEYQNTFGEWIIWTESVNFNNRTYQPVFYTLDAAKCCAEIIKQNTSWKSKPFRVRLVSIIKMRKSYKCE